MNVNVGNKEVRTVGQTRVTPVAVIGMRCRLPGGIDSPQLLCDDLVTEVPSDRWDADEYYDPEEPGAFLDNVADFDQESFWITFYGVSSAVLTSKALLGKYPGPISGSMEAPLTTIRGSRISSLLGDLEKKWSE
jgi:hypothetical protein